MAGKTAPFSRFEWMIAWRYMRAKRETGGVSIMTWISLIGVTLAVFALIAVLAVRSGFRADFVDTIVGANAHLTVRQNLEFPLKSPVLQTPKDDIKRKVGEVAEVLQISHKLDNKATALSGGEMQRVSIGRALVRDPSVYLMDEPLSSLDAKLRSDLRVELKNIQANSGATLLYVTHDQIEAMTMATHVGVLDNGRLVQFGSPREIYENPVSVYAASRLGQPRINVLPADIFAGAPAGAQTIGLRPEHIIQEDGEDSMVKRVERLGDQTRLHLSFKDRELITVTDAHTQLKHGDIVKIRPENPYYFDAAGARVA